MKWKIAIISSVFMLLNFLNNSYAKQSWYAFLQEIRHEAMTQGIRPAILDEAFNGFITPNWKVLKYDKTQPEKRITFIKYRDTRADSYRIHLGQKELKKHYALLKKISNDYGVSACFIVSLWGLETSYGRYMGTFPVIYSLATLAYDNRRADFFHKELLIALNILNNSHVQLKDFKGEWAGASGHPQFLPSSWYEYAVDYDGDGHKDIWKSLPDSFASIANYLYKNGWHHDEPWMIPVTVPSHFDKSLMSINITKTISQWKNLGVQIDQNAQVSNHLEASIIEPYGGPTMMVFNNFKVIMKWNRSTYYAGTVGYMAEKICKE